MRPVGAIEDIAGAAELDQQVAGPRDAGSQGRGHVVGAAGGDGRTGGQSRLPGRPGRDVPGAGIGIADGRQLAGAQPRGIHVLGYPGPGVHVPQAALDGPVQLKARLTGQSQPRIIIRPKHGADAPPHLRLVALHPAHARSDVLRGGDGAGARQHGLLIQRRAQLLHLGMGARIVLLDAGAQRTPRLVEQDDGRHHAAQADGRDLAWAAGGRAPPDRARRRTGHPTTRRGLPPPSRAAG